MNNATSILHFKNNLKLGIFSEFYTRTHYRDRDYAPEGCKLLVRNSKGGGQEEYYVDSIEVVSFGRSFFFRSQERPKSFLVPVSDYEILEQKEARISLKNAAPERSIKIGGGREGPVRSSRESAPEGDFYEPQEREHPEQRPPMDRDRKRDKRRVDVVAVAVQKVQYMK